MSADADLTGRLGALEERVARAEAALAIQALKADYGDLVDGRYSRGAVVGSEALEEIVGRIVALFTEDAVWDGSPVLGIATGRAEIAARLSAPTLSFSRHLFTKPRIEVHGVVARGRWDLLCPCTTPDGRSWWMCGYEDDEYRLDDGIWRHSAMRLTTLFMSETGEGFDRILA